MLDSLAREIMLPSKSFGVQCMDAQMQTDVNVSPLHLNTTAEHGNYFEQPTVIVDDFR
jgi:hypothetical protein